MGGNDPNDLRQVGAKRFVGALIEGDRAGVVDFDSYGSLTQPLTTDFDAANASIDAIDSSGGTNIGAGLNAANNEFDSSSNSSRAKITILLSDGYTSYRGSALAAAQDAADRDVTVYTIGFGNPDDALMQDIADTTGGTYTFVDDVNDLPDVFSRIAENATEAEDSDGDGLPDAVETGGIRSGTGQTYYTDPNDPDTDGDGLSDGVEAGPRIGDSHYDVGSNLQKADTDSDGLSDYDETQSPLDSFDHDTDDDGLDDLDDPNPLEPEADSGTSTLDIARAIVEGGVLGEVGFSDGFPVSGYRNSPYYLASWITVSVIPGVDIIADLRDLAQNLADGDTFEAALDAAGLIPLFGKVGDGAKAVKVAAKWIKKFPRKVGKATKTVSEFGVKYIPDESLRIKIYRALGNGPDISRLKAQGLTDGQIQRLLTRLPSGVSLSDVRRAAESDAGKMVYITRRSFNHVDNRHITGVPSKFRPNAPSDFFPLGQVVTPPRGATKRMPDRMDVSDVEDMTIAAMTDGSPVPGDAWAKVYNPTKNGFDHGIENIRVVVDQNTGELKTAYPDGVAGTSSDWKTRWNPNTGTWEFPIPDHTP